MSSIYKIIDLDKFVDLCDKWHDGDSEDLANWNPIIKFLEETLEKELAAQKRIAEEHIQLSLDRRLEIDELKFLLGEAGDCVKEAIGEEREINVDRLNRWNGILEKIRMKLG